ncbi:MAG: hypothetical protein MJ208_01095 [Bacilli bacterium]|nr:hypothetical protein [Bacilli bacterium]
MKTNISKSKALRLCAFALLGGTMISTTGCNNGNIDINKLFFTVKGNQLEVAFCDRGASIYSIKYKDQFVTYHPKDKETFITNNFYGKCLGRVAGRIPDGKLKIGENEYYLDINETKGGKNNCLHGGTNGLFNKDWTHNITEDKNYFYVTFNYTSPADESGFPEILNVKYAYKVSKNDGELSLDINASSSGLTPVNLSFHPYFRLGNSGTIEKHKLTVNANNIAKYDNEGHQTVIGTESVTAEGNSPWNFTTTKEIGKDIEEAAKKDEVSGGYDHIWCFNNGNIGEHDFELRNEETNIKLNVTSEDSDAVIMYSNCWPNLEQEMNDGEKDTKYAAITIEPYTFFTTEKESIEKLFIDKDKSFARHITYKFSSIS